ncbi:fatty acid 2-hydroxylase [Maniola hyperantus]|uniref:fatty acid 2-hydroxylase n=1 Tax=Aphantopus hyperantus TaxID=2795564 RepID=UPI001569E46D|nr:fatty acid 2-hydroxylase [Maniola hyperantus]
MASTEFAVNFGGKTYDLRRFVRDHPGGINTLEKFRGKPIGQVMKLYGHSDSAYHMLNDFRVESGKDVNLTGGVSTNGRIITKEEADMDHEQIALLEELESRLDWSKPLLGQLQQVAPHYGQWVNSAVYRRCRLFASPVLESLTFTPWYIVPMFWIPIIVCLGVAQFRDRVFCGDSCEEARLSGLEFVGHVVFGVFLWTLLEYSLHRWVFHHDPGSSLILIQLHFLIHGMHHKVPFDGLRQVFPPIPALLLAVVLYLPASLLFTHPMIKLTGALIGYLTYDMIHYYVHHGAPRDGTYLYAMKRYHSNHHFLNHDKAFGISSKLWDHIFKTFVQVKNLGFSLHW